MNTCGKQKKINDQNNQEKHKKQKYMPPQGLTVFIRNLKINLNELSILTVKVKRRIVFLFTSAYFCVSKRKNKQTSRHFHILSAWRQSTLFIFFIRGPLLIRPGRWFTRDGIEKQKLCDKISLSCVKKIILCRLLMIDYFVCWILSKLA